MAEHSQRSLDECPVLGTGFTLDKLMHAISDGRHDIDLPDFAERMGLGKDWDWGDVQFHMEAKGLSVDDIDTIIHRGLR